MAAATFKIPLDRGEGARVAAEVGLIQAAGRDASIGELLRHRPGRGDTIHGPLQTDRGGERGLGLLPLTQA